MLKQFWAFVWRAWIDSDEFVVKVTGWNSAIIGKQNGHRKHVTNCLSKTIRRKWFDA